MGYSMMQFVEIIIDDLCCNLIHLFILFKIMQNLQIIISIYFVCAQIKSSALRSSGGLPTGRNLTLHA